MKLHGFLFDEIEKMVPWEKQVYLGLLLDHIEKQEKARLEAEAKLK